MQIMARLRRLFAGSKASRGTTSRLKSSHLWTRLSQNIASRKRWWRYVSIEGRTHHISWVQVRDGGLMLRVDRLWAGHMDGARTAEWRAEAASAIRLARAEYEFNGGRQGAGRSVTATPVIDANEMTGYLIES